VVYKTIHSHLIKKNNAVAFIILMLVFACCKEEPSYNPFDEQFNVSVSQVVKNECDTIPAGCGYINLKEKEGRGRTYYQVSYDFFDEVVAKGFIYDVDTFEVDYYQGYYLDRKLVDSLKQFFIPTEHLNKNLSKYEYSFLDRSDNIVRISNTRKQDTIELKVTISEANSKNQIVRTLEYYASKPN